MLSNINNCVKVNFISQITNDYIIKCKQTLSPYEQTILEYVYNNKKIKEISNELNISYAETKYIVKKIQYRLLKLICQNNNFLL